MLTLGSLALAGCGSRDEPMPTDSAEAAPRAGSLRYLALGDSYTIGESVAPAERWPVQLAARLREAGLDVADPEIIARTGWRTDDLDAAVTRADPQAPYALVSLLIGVNNQYQGRSAGEYRREFAELLRRAVGFAGGEPSRVLVLSIPDWGATPFAEGSDRARVAREIDAFNEVNREESRKAGVRYVDVTPVSRLATREPELVAEDGLHPSGKMYERWVELALPVARDALGKVPAAPGNPGG